MAGAAEPAVAWYGRAAEIARGQYANVEALEALERAIALLDDRPGDRVVAAGLFEAWGDCLVVAGRLPEADEAYHSALAACPADDRLRLAALYQKVVQIYPPQGRMEESAAIYQKALAVLGPAPGDLPPVAWWRVWLEIQIGRQETLYFQGRTAELAELTRQVEPILAQYGTPDHRVDYQLSQLMLLHRTKRFAVDPADLVEPVKAIEGAPPMDEMKRAFLEFGLGFGHFSAGLLPEAADYLTAALAKAEEMVYLPLQDQCLAYLTITARLTGDVERARLYQARSAGVAYRVGVPYYLGVVAANQAWLDYLDGRWARASAGAQKALEQWQGYSYPFHWLAHWPLLAVARDEPAAAVASAKAMLDPEQQRLPNDVTRTLSRAVDAWEAGDPDIAREALKQAAVLARNHNYL
jgi:hypothetical protein